MGHDVLIGADGAAGELLKSEFSDLEFIDVSGYLFRYGNGNSQIFTILKQLPSFLISVRKEHELLKKIIDKYKIDIVISDNRYGLWSNKIPSVIICHQIFIKAPGLLSIMEPLLHKLHLYLLNKFNFCWIPDLPHDDFNLSGDLSHKKPLPKKFIFIGLLSRFDSHIKKGTPENIVAILSGPEPQRTHFQKILEQQLLQYVKPSIIISGNKNEKPKQLEQLKIIPLADSQQLKEQLQNDPIVISRSGYSSLMDYVAMGIQPIIVPTPGQTEQEYLAKYLKEKKWCYSLTQRDFNIKKGIAEKVNYNFPEELRRKNNYLERAVKDLLILQ